VDIVHANILIFPSFEFKMSDFNIVKIIMYISTYATSMIVIIF